jgi:transitional endoplasmic reticulum ATPase
VGYVGADIEAACREAATIAVREFVGGEGGDATSITLTAAHFDSAVEAIDRGRDGRTDPFDGSRAGPGRDG